MYESSANPYLEQEVLTASPAKLRWLLLQKSLNLTQITIELWKSGDFKGSQQWTVWLRDVLNELLCGVHGTDDLAKQVTDLYIFMLTLLTEAELQSNVTKLQELKGLLEIEAETWMQVQLKLSGKPASAPIAPLSNVSTTDNSFCVDA